MIVKSNMPHVSWTETVRPSEFSTEQLRSSQSEFVYNLDSFSDATPYDKISHPGTTDAFTDTFSSPSGYLTLTQTTQVAASQSFFRYLQFNKAMSDLEWEISITYTPTHVFNAELRGIGIGMLSANSDTGRKNSVIHFLSHATTSLDRSRLTCTSSIAASESDLNNASRTFVYDGANSLNTAVQNQKVTLTLRQLLCRFEAEVTNHATGVTKRITKDMDFYSDVRPTNTGRPCIFSIGGTYVIEKFTVRSLQPIHPRVMFIGDSKTVGSRSTPIKKGFAHLFKLNAAYPVAVCAGQADATAEVSLMVPSLLQRCIPRYVVLCIGRNDIVNGQISLQTQTNYKTAVDALERAGVTVYHLLPIPERVGVGAAADQTQLTNWIQSNYSSIIPVPSSFVVSTDVDGDNVHPNASGHTKIYQHLQTFFLSV